MFFIFYVSLASHPHPNQLCPEPYPFGPAVLGEGQQPVVGIRHPVVLVQCVEDVYEYADFSLRRFLGPHQESYEAVSL